MGKAKSRKKSTVAAEPIESSNPVLGQNINGEALDPFDIANLRLDQNFIESAGTTKLLTTVPVGKPGNQDFSRVHPGRDYRENFGLVELKDEREFYLVIPSIARQLPGEVAMYTLYTAINRQGVVRLWPVRLPDSDGKLMEWHRSAREATELAMKKWVRLKANRSLGAYEIFIGAETLSEPEWPNTPFKELLRTAFRDHRLVNKEDHPLIQRLRGRA